MFNEDEIKTFYTGRKIRVNNISQDSLKEPRFATRMRDDFGIDVNNRVEERQNNQRITWHVNDQAHGEGNINSPINRLVRAIQDNLDGRASNGKQIIGVFGMNSDNLVINAMNRVDRNIRGNINYHDLPVQRFMGGLDVYSLFAVAMLNFCRDRSNADRYFGNYREERRNYDYLVREIYVLLDSIGASTAEYDYDEGLGRLQRLGERMQRPNKCQEVLRKVCELVGDYNVKFIWKVEIPMGMLSMEILEQFSKLSSQNFIIIFNMLTPLNLEASVVGSNVGYMDSPSQSGYHVLQKYVWFENLISCD